MKKYRMRRLSPNAAGCEEKEEKAEWLDTRARASEIRHELELELEWSVERAGTWTRQLDWLAVYVGPK
jgi:hypothetical protein